MKRIFAGALVLIMFMAVLANAVEWNGRLGFGLRGPLFAPMIKGSEFKIPGQTTYEPFMMGLGGGVEVKYGLTKSLVVGLSGGYWYTYNDSTSAEDQSFKLNNRDKASVKLKVMPIGLTGQYYFIPNSNVQPYLLAGVGIDMVSIEEVSSGNSYSVKDLNGKVGAGFNFWIGEKLTFDLGFRFSYLLSNLSSDVPDSIIGNTNYTQTKSRPYVGVMEPGIGITYFFGGPKDTDKDGIKDKFDQCPNTPIGAIVDQFGCPIDSDGDGVYDGLDRCPDTPRGAVVDINGCPIDSDSDGVYDGLDKCPDTPKGVAVDLSGCPLDGDGDGVPDYLDKQPNTPKGAKVDVDGVALDGDSDGIPDGLDKCPDTPAGTKVDEFGCPMAKPISDKITLNIKYEPNSAEPDSAAKVALDEIAVSLKAFPETKISINGFTDALGSARTNLKISQERADTILRYFQDRGITPDRMVAKGYGEDKNYFVGDNDTPEGRAKNRRIEIAPQR